MRDEFEVVSFANNDGSKKWEDAWGEHDLAGRWEVGQGEAAAGVRVDDGGEAQDAAVEHAELANPLPNTSEVLAAAKKTYTRECLVCHWDAGRGDGQILILIR